MRFRRFAIAAAILLVAASANGQQAIRLQFTAGRVSLSAQNAPVRAILAEWARLGGATIVNGDRVAGPPVTLELADVPERQALDTILRTVAGYIVAPRPAGSQGLSAFDRIMILPTSVAPITPPPPAVAGLRPGLPRLPVIARPPNPNQTLVEEETDTPDPLEDPSALNQGRRIAQPPVVTQPPTDEPDEDPASDDEPQDGGTPPPAVATTPGNPFGVPAGSSATPGVIAPVPQTQRPNQAPTNRVQ